MRNRLPRPRELAFFVILAVACTLIVAATGKHDVAFAVLGAPVFLVAALMGHRRSRIKPAVSAVPATANESRPVGPGPVEPAESVA